MSFHTPQTRPRQRPLRKPAENRVPGSPAAGIAQPKLAGMQAVADNSATVERLQVMQRVANTSGPRETGAGADAPLQRKVIIGGAIYGSMRELASSKDKEAYSKFAAVEDPEKRTKLSAEERYELKGGTLVAAVGDVEAEAPELIESASERAAREYQEEKAATASAVAHWGAKIDELNAKIDARRYRTHGRSYAHLAAPDGDGLTALATAGDVRDYVLAQKATFTCVGAQEFDGRAAGVFRGEIEESRMGERGRRGAIILLLLFNGTVVLHHFGNI